MNNDIQITIVDPGFPPIYERAQEVFDLSGMQPVFTYGEVIYNPHGNYLDEPLLAHERVHSLQQSDGPLAWWERYFVDASFRFDQEIEAYREQYRVAKRTIKDRNALNHYVRRLAQDLSSPMYGNIVSFTEALRLIKAA